MMSPATWRIEGFWLTKPRFSPCELSDEMPSRVETDLRVSPPPGTRLKTCPLRNHVGTENA